MEKDCREWKLKTVDPQERSIWRSGVRSAMRAASKLPGKGPTDVDDAPACQSKSDYDVITQSIPVYLKHSIIKGLNYIIFTYLIHVSELKNSGSIVSRSFNINFLFNIFL